MGLPPLGAFGARPPMPPMGMPQPQPMGLPPAVSFNYGAPVQPQPVMGHYQGQPYAAQPYGAPVRVVQSHRPPVIQQAAPAPLPEQSAPMPEVTLSGRTGVNDVVNGTYVSCGEYGGRYYFSMATNEGPIYLY